MNTIKLILLLLIFTSCAAWRVEETQPLNTFPKSLKIDNKKPKTSITFKKFDVTYNGVIEKDELTQEKRAMISSLVEKAYKASGIFNIVDEDSPNKDMSIEIDITKKISGSPTMRWVTALTLYLVPRQVVEEITVTTRFLDKKGELVGMVEKIDKAVTWHQFFMIFALPFSSTPNSVVVNTVEDLNKATIVDAFQDGYFVDINE